jgi:hypothetical protein
MPSQYDIDTKFLESLLRICFTVAIFSLAFLVSLIPVGAQIKLIQQLYILFLMLFTLFLGATFFIFIMWYSKYKPSFFKIKKK